MTLAQALLASGAGAALTAAAVSVFVLREAVLDLQAVVRSGVINGRRAVARREVEAETARMAALLLFALAAGSSMVASPDDAVAPPAVVVGLSAFLVGQVVLAVDSVRALVARRKMMRRG